MPHAPLLQLVNVTLINIMNNDPTIPNICVPLQSAIQTCVPSNATEGCASSSSWPAGILDCHNKAGCNPYTTPLDTAFMDAKLKQYAAQMHVDVGATTAAVAFSELTSKEFGVGGTTVFASGLRTKFQFAIPLPGYANADDR